MNLLTKKDTEENPGLEFALAKIFGTQEKEIEGNETLLPHCLQPEETNGNATGLNGKQDLSGGVESRNAELPSSEALLTRGQRGEESGKNVAKGTYGEACPLIRSESRRNGEDTESRSNDLPAQTLEEIVAELPYWSPPEGYWMIAPPKVPKADPIIGRKVRLPKDWQLWLARPHFNDWTLGVTHGVIDSRVIDEKWYPTGGIVVKLLRPDNTLLGHSVTFDALELSVAQIS